MPIWINADYSEIDNELDRIIDMPNDKTTGLLDAVLDFGFKQTQAATHVLTGSLKSSLKKDSKETDSTWRGTISAGGASLGINNPVNYAIYEKARGGDHDFFGNLHLLHQMYIAALLKGLSK